MASRSPLSEMQVPWLPVGAILASAAILYAQLWFFAPPDYSIFLKPWYQHILDRGPIEAFATPSGDYAPTYLYLLAVGTRFDALAGSLPIIKTISLLGTLFLAFSMFVLSRTAGVRQPLLAGALVLVLPTPLLNAGLLSKCDALWVGCYLLAVAAALQERFRTMLLWAGLAVSFKAQAAFIAPVVIGLLLRHRCPLQWWLIPPVVYAAAMLPDWLAGWPAVDLATIYLRQAGSYAHVGTAPNMWVFGRVYAPELSPALLPFGLLLGALAAGSIAVRTASARKLDIVEAALLSALLVPFILPKMHERYFLLADMLAFAAAAIARTRRTFLVAVLVNGASLLALISYTQATPVPVLAGAVLSSAAVLILLAGLAGSVLGRRATPVALPTPA